MRDSLENDAPGIDPAVARRIGFGMIGLVALGAVALLLLRKPPEPPPPEIASDPLLLGGREVFLSRCISCHGQKGKGDGPIAKSLTGKPVGDLTAAHWKHGDKAEQVRAVIALGVPNTNMTAWGRTLSEEELKGVTAYVFFLAGREMPPELRKP